MASIPGRARPARALAIAAGVALTCAASTVEAQWQTVSPGAGTVCSDGSPYRFFVHPGDPAKLLVEFEGGGACWSAESCESEIYTRRVTLDPAEVARRGPLPGIYDRSRAENPLRDFTHVYVPYCTGDLHWGNTSQTYTGTRGPYVVHHRGAINAKAALGWAYDNVLAPRQVFVAGCSAGGYGAIAWSADVLAHYPGASAAHLSDSAAGITPDGFFGSVLNNWGVADSPAWPAIPALALDRLDLTRAGLPDMYDAVAGHFPLASFAQFNTLQDATQIFFYWRTGSVTPADWSARMQESVARIRAQNVNFTAYVAPGNEHCIVNRPEVYTTTVGVRFVDWLRDLVHGPRPPAVP